MIIGGGGGNLEDQRVENYGFYSKTIIDHHFIIMDILSEGCFLSWKVYNMKEELIDSFSVLSSSCKEYSE